MSKQRKFFVTVTAPGRPPLTIERMERNASRLARKLEEEFPGASFDWSEHAAPRPIERPWHQLEQDWEAEGRRIALEGMGLPDGAYFAMAEELGLDPY